MSNLLYILIAILMLGFICMVHELGHYIVGRLCGIGILEFSIGFGPKLIGFRRKDIDYSLRLFPLGGYCAFVSDEEGHPAAASMYKMPVWKRFLTVIAGPAMNALLAFVFCALLLSGFTVAEYLPRIHTVYESTPAAACGLEAGDVLTEVNGAPLSFDEEGVTAFRAAIENLGEAPMRLGVDRGGEALTLCVQPEKIVDAQSGETRYQLGIAFDWRNYSVGEALGSSFKYMLGFTKAMLQALKDLVFHGSGVETVTGPVGVIQMVSSQISVDHWHAVVYLTFFLSLNLGIINMLPLPGLDGGRVVFLIVEAIRRKPIPPEKEGMVHAMGMLLLFLLIVFITYKDIIRLFTGA